MDVPSQLEGTASVRPTGTFLVKVLDGDAAVRTTTLIWYFVDTYLYEGTQ